MIRSTEQLDEVKGPYDVDAEMSFLGSFAICDDRPRQHRLRSMLTADAFFQPDHGYYFTAMAAIIDDGRPLDAITLRAELQQRNTFEDCGGEPYLRDIVHKAPSHLHAEFYAKIIEELHLRRLGIAVGRELSARLMRPALEQTASAVLEDAINAAVKIRQRRNRVEVFTLGDIVADFIEQKDAGESPALMTGISLFDAYLGIFSFGKYTIIAGRPSMGKSTMCRWLLQKWAEAGAVVGLVAVEEDRTKIAGNYLSSVSGVENSTLAYRKLNELDVDRVTAASMKLAGHQWYGIDTAFSLTDVSNAVEILATEKQCRVIAVDHLHLISTAHHYENGHQKVKEISQRLKELGKRHGVVLIAAAQLSRPAKGAIPPPPTLTDLRESGSIEEHADAVLMLHRDDYYRKGNTHACQIFVRKNRNGRRGDLAMYEELANQRFREPTAQEADAWSRSDAPDAEDI